MQRLKDLFLRYRQPAAYIFWGGCTTLVNLSSYYLLGLCTGWDYNLRNLISVSLAILFAYFVNARFVFHSAARGAAGRLQEFARFAGARLLTMALEVGGVFAMVELLALPDQVSKLVIQFVVLALNYIFSKLLVFKKREEEAP